MKTFVLTGLLLLTCATTSKAQRCDCTITPYEPNPPCFDICTRNLLATTSLEDLIYILGLKEDTARRIVNWPKRSFVRSLEEYGEILSAEELQDLARRANSLNRQQLLYIYRGRESAQGDPSQRKGTTLARSTRTVGEALAEFKRSASQDPNAAATGTRQGSKKTEDPATYHYYKDSQGQWRWRLKAGNGRIIAESGDGYSSESECLAEIERVKSSKDAPLKKE